MDHFAHFDWPFFEPRHRELARELDAWASRELAAAHPTHGGAELDGLCRDLVARLGTGGWLRWAVPEPTRGESFDLRSFCVCREILARHSPLADFAFAMQGLGTAPVTLYGSAAQQNAWLPPARAGERIAAFAISEAEAGSDVGAMTTTARREGDWWVLDGEKTWISNAGIADHYLLFARWPENGDRSYCSFMIPADTPGFSISERLETVAPHPLGTLTLKECRVAGGSVVGEPGRGLRVALGTLDLFRAGVGAAALGMARRAAGEAVEFARGRTIFGSPLSGFQLTQAKLADMATALDAGALLVYRAAWLKDGGAERVTRESAMAKLYATEAAQRVIDEAVQLLGARGVLAGSPVEQLYREIRALRIYEGTSEIQKIVIGRSVMEEGNPARR